MHLMKYISLIFIYFCVTKALHGQDTLQGPNREGPTNRRIIDLTIDSDHEFGSQKVISLGTRIYGDANPLTGFYYYLPSSYSLQWNITDGTYGFEVRYSTLGVQGGKGKTTVTAILQPRLENADLEIAKNQINKFLQNESPLGKFKLKELSSMPLNRTEISFTNLSQFGITTNDYSIRPPADPAEPIFISFTTTQIDELMGMFFSNIGLYGDVVFYPDGKEMPINIRVPFNLKLNSPATYGKMVMDPKGWRTQGWQNKTDFPVGLQNFHVLRLEGLNHRIYSWKLNNTDIFPKAKAEFDGSSVPTWIDNDPTIKRIWLDYTIKDCNSCIRTVKDKIIPKETLRLKQPIKIEITNLNSKEFTKAAIMQVIVKSYQVDLTGTNAKEVKVEFSSDNKTDGTILYVADGESPDYLYKIRFVMNDGAIHETKDWIASKDQNIYIGKVQIQSLIPYFKK